MIISPTVSHSRVLQILPVYKVKDDSGLHSLTKYSLSKCTALGLGDTAM